MVTHRPWLHLAALAVLSWGVAACVTKSEQPAPLTDADVNGAPVAGAKPGAAAKVVNDDDPSLALRLDADWSDIVSRDVAELEKKTEDFIASASKLYDLLLDDSRIAKPADLDGALTSALGTYRLMTQAAERLAGNLERTDVHGSMSADDSFTEQYERVRALVATYRTAPPVATHYDANDKKPLTLVFNAQVTPAEGELSPGAIPKQQRDALALLDWLQQVGNDMSFVSTAVTGWVAQNRQQNPPHGLTMDTLAH